MMKMSAKSIVLIAVSLMPVVKHVGCVVKIVHPLNLEPVMERRGTANGLQIMELILDRQKHIAIREIMVHL
jgi:hypothetical protein